METDFNELIAKQGGNIKVAVLIMVDKDNTLSFLGKGIDLDHKYGRDVVVDMVQQAVDKYANGEVFVR